MKPKLYCLLILNLLLRPGYGQDTLYLGFGSNINQSEQSKALVAGLCTYLSEQIGKPVYPVQTKGAGAFVEALRAQKIDLALVNTFGYVLARHHIDIEPLLVVAQDNKPISYSSCIVAHVASGLRSLQDLKKQAGRQVFLFVNPGSTSGHLVPRLQLNRMGLQPEFAFSDIAFAGDHVTAAEQLANGTYQVGACACDDLEKLFSEGKIGRDQLFILWRSEPIVNGPVAVRTDLASSLKQSIAAAFVQMPEKNAALHEKVVRLWHNTDQKAVHYISAQDSWYNYIRSIAASMEELALLVSLYVE